MHLIGICASVTDAPALAAAGADFVEEIITRFLVPEGPAFTAPKTAIPILAANVFFPPTLKCVGPVVETARLVRYADTAFRRAQEAGIQTIVFGSGGSRNIPEGFSKSKAEEQFVALLKKIAPLARRSGITIVIEPLNKKACNFILSVREADELARACNHPNVRVLADIYHMLHDGQTPDDILRYGSWLRHVHIAELEGHAAPGVHGEDFRAFFRALKKVSYTGPVSMECNWGDLATEAGLAVTELRRQINAA